MIICANCTLLRLLRWQQRAQGGHFNFVLRVHAAQFYCRKISHGDETFERSFVSIRSLPVIRLASFSACAAAIPPKPAPMIATRCTCSARFDSLFIGQARVRFRSYWHQNSTMKLPSLRLTEGRTRAAATSPRKAIRLPRFGPVDIFRPRSVIALATKASSCRDSE